MQIPPCGTCRGEKYGKGKTEHPAEAECPVSDPEGANPRKGVRADRFPNPTIPGHPEKIMLSEEELQAQAEACASGDPYSGPCPRCGESAGFSRHQVQPRTWWLPVGIEVLHIRSVISRWLCLLCGKIFTRQPPFSAPNRRYVRDAIEERPRDYVEDKAESYRAAASTGPIQLEHEKDGWKPPPPPVPVPVNGEPWTSHLARSTIWRWVGAWGSQINAFGAAMRWIQLADPSNAIHRFIPDIPARKYRSEKRRDLLRQARYYLRALAEITVLRKRPPPITGSATPE